MKFQRYCFKTAEKLAGFFFPWDVCQKLFLPCFSVLFHAQGNFFELHFFLMIKQSSEFSQIIYLNIRPLKLVWTKSIYLNIWSLKLVWTKIIYLNIWPLKLVWKKIIYLNIWPLKLVWTKWRSFWMSKHNSDQYF